MSCYNGVIEFVVTMNMAHVSHGIKCAMVGHTAVTAQMKIFVTLPANMELCPARQENYAQNVFQLNVYVTVLQTAMMQRMKKIVQLSANFMENSSVQPKITLLPALPNFLVNKICCIYNLIHFPQKTT
mgnify:CR=1 FL=1